MALEVNEYFGWLILNSVVILIALCGGVGVDSEHGLGGCYYTLNYLKLLKVFKIYC